jgi:hypothetical protein
MSKIKVTATKGICGHLNVPTMASLTPHKNVHTYARLYKMLQYRYQRLCPIHYRTPRRKQAAFPGDDNRK